MRCHYTTDPTIGKVFIPGCWGAAVHGTEFCHCRAETFHAFEKERYNEKLKELQTENKSLTDEVIRLNRLLRKKFRKSVNNL